MFASKGLQKPERYFVSIADYYFICCTAFDKDSIIAILKFYKKRF